MLKRIRGVFQEHKKTISGFFWAAVTSLIILGPAFLHIIGGEVAMFVIVLILLAYLELLGGQLRGSHESMETTHDSMETTHDSMETTHESMKTTQESMKTLLEDIKDLLKSPASIYKEQSPANQDLISYVQSGNLEEADMLEYSSSTVHSVLEALVKNRIRIRLLLKNPKEALNEEQKKRICAQLKRIKIDLDGDFEIRCYNQRASLRGRKFDDKLINVGWYTYRILDKKTGKMGIRGHSNPVLTLKRGEDGYFEIRNFFDEVFENLMEEAVPLKKVCGDCEEDCVLSGEKEKEWLEKVSKQR